MRLQRTARLQTAMAVVLFAFSTAWDAVAHTDEPKIFAREHEYEDFRIVLELDAPEPDHTAARAFQKYWQESTGYLIPLLTEREPGKINVYIGAYSSPRLDESEFTPDEVDGVAIRTVLKWERPRIWRMHTKEKRRLPIELRELHIGGAPSRGTLFAVYEFFERYMGVRWLTPDETHVPRPPDYLPEIAFRYVPPFVRRDVSFHSIVENPEFAAAMRLNGPWAGLPESMGGHIRHLFDRKRLAHTYHEYVPPARYFDEHPEYFALVDGRRDREGQLCLTNPDLPQIVADAIVHRAMEQNLYSGIIDLSQMDWGGWCECAACASVIAEEGGPAGLNIRFVNEVADLMAQRLPGVFLQTLAYRETRKPPRHVRPRENVVVGVCAFEVDNTRPIFDRHSARNRAYVKDLRRWREIARYVYVWDYTQNWYAHQGPHPIYPTIQPNAAFYAELEINSVFHQAVPASPHSDFEHLKAYMLARTLWNPSLDGHALYNEFLRLYYREAAPYIRAYHALLAEQVARTGAELTMANSMDWIDTPTVERAQAIFADAFENISDPKTRERLKYAYLPVQYAALVAPPEVRYAGDSLILKRPQSQTFDEYWAMLHEYGVTHLNDYSIDLFRERLDGETPPRRRDVPLVELQNDRYEVWIAPGQRGAVVRMQDRRTGRELVTAYPSFSVADDHSLEWKEDNGRLRSVDAAFDVIADDGQRAVLEATLEHGLLLQRTMALDQNAIDFIWTISNPTANAVTPNLQIRPTFRGVGGIHRVDADSEAGTARMAARLHNPREVLLVAFEGAFTAPVIEEPAEGDGLTMGVRFSDEPLAPGASQTVTAKLRVTDKHPRRL